MKKQNRLRLSGVYVSCSLATKIGGHINIGSAGSPHKLDSSVHISALPRWKKVSPKL